MTAWDNTDLRALRRIGAGLGSFQVLKIEENRMTDQAPEMDQSESWDNAAPADEPGPYGRGATYPEHSYKLADHVYTWSPKLPDGSMLVVRAQSAEELAEKAEALTAVSGRLAAAWRQVTGAGAPAPQMPFQGQQAATPPPFGPNVSVPQAPGYQGPPATRMPQQQGWGGQPQQQWNNGGGGQQQGERKQYPAPQGWYKLNVPFPGGKDRLHSLAQELGIPKGNPDKGGMYNFWGLTPAGQAGKAWYCAPAVASAFSQFNPVPA